MRCRLPMLARRRSGFTLLELMLGMVITGLIMSAIAALLAAVGKGWQQSSSATLTANTTAQTHLRLQRILRAAKQIGAVRLGSLAGTATQPAAVMFWKGDANRDNKVQFSELAMLIHDDPTSGYGSIIYYDVVYPTSWTAAQKTAADTPALADDEIYKDTNLDTFKNLTNVRATKLVSNVIGVEFRRIDGASVIRPALEYVINLYRNGASEVEYGTVAVRTPATLPASQSGG